MDLEKLVAKGVALEQHNLLPHFCPSMKERLTLKAKT